MDRVTDRPSPFMQVYQCAVCMQIGYYNMEIIDAVDINSPTYDTAWTQYHFIDMVDVDHEDLKSPGSNTVWVRPPPVLPDLRIKNSQVIGYSSRNVSSPTGVNCPGSQNFRLLRFKGR